MRLRNFSSAPKVYKIGDDTVPSFTAVVGTRRFSGANTSQDSESSITSSYYYSGIENAEKDAQNYKDYLLENRYFELVNWSFSDEEQSGMVVIPLINGISVDADKRLTMLITYDVQKKTVDISLTKDNKDIADKQTRTVGQDSHGFLDIPEDYHVFYSIERTETLLSWARDAKTIVHLDIMPDGQNAEAYATKSMNHMIRLVGEENVGSGYEEMDGYKAYYIVSKHPNNAVLLTWYFDDDNGTTHYVAAESLQDEWEEVYNIAHTFRLGNQESE